MNHEKEWTTMIFMSGENNLSIEIAYSLLGWVVFCTLHASEIEALSDGDIEYRDPVLLKTYKNCVRVIEGIRRSLLLSGFSGGEFQHSTGISVFFPMSLSAYGTANEDYEGLKLVSANLADGHGIVFWSNI